MTNKYDAPSGAPPAYGTPHQGPATPQQAYMAPQGSDHYNASPYQQHGSPYPAQHGSPFPQQQGPYGPPPQQGYGGPQPGYPPQGGYYQQGPPMGYQQQGGMYPPGPGYGQPQGHYVDNRGRSGSDGCLGACLGALACCCCLDLLF